MALADAPGFQDDELGRRRRLAELLMRGATDASPVGHWTQALARALQGGMAGYGAYRDRMDSNAGMKALLDMYQSGGSSSVAASGMPAAPAGTAAGTFSEPSRADAPKPMDASMRPEIGRVARSLAGGQPDWNSVRANAEDVQLANEGMVSPLPDELASQQRQTNVPMLPNPLSNFDASGRFLGARPQPAANTGPRPPLAIDASYADPLSQADVSGGVTASVPPAGGVAAALAGQATQPVDFRGQRGPAAIRFNNPGAQYPGPSAQRFGSTGTETIGGGHKIAVFPDAVSGAAAQFDLLNRRYAGMPLSAAITRWSGGNSSPAYIARVSRETGLSPDTVLTPELLQSPQGVQLARAMAGMEAGRSYPMGEEQWGQAQRMAFGGTGAQPTQASTAQPQQQPVRMAQAVTREQIARLLSSPHTRAIGLRMLMESRGPLGESGQLDLESKRLDLAAKRRDLETPKGELVKLKEGESAHRFNPRTGTMEMIGGAAPGGVPEQTQRNIYGGLNELYDLPDRYQGTFEQSVGPFQGDESGITSNPLGPLARLYGSAVTAGEKTSPSEVRRAIRGATETFSAVIKPLIRKPGEGSWSDADQAKLNAIVGDLAQASTVEQYRRELDNVRKRINANFGTNIPGIGQQPRAAPGGNRTKTINGKTYVQVDGQWYEQ